MAIMLRQVGIPSRNVTGFVGGTYNRFGHYYAVREGDAHSWVEAYIDDPLHGGWQTFDPTPAAGAQPLEDTSGAFVYIRDIIEALSQRWNRYVIGYDLRTQVHLFEDISRRYEGLRSRAGVNKGPFDRLTRAPSVAAAILAVSLAAYVVWKRRRLGGATSQRDNPLTKTDPKLETATALYRALEAALSSHGISRPPSLPPLRHAEDLGHRKHPLAPEVLALTEVYLETRFGKAELTDVDKQNFERRVREIRSYRAPAAVLGA
jgi:hypothetical protein